MDPVSVVVVTNSSLGHRLAVSYPAVPGISTGSAVASPKRIRREDVLARVRAAFAGGPAPSMDEMAAAAGVSRAGLYGLFGSRAALLEAIGAALPPAVPDRILAAAAELVAERGLGGLSLDEVAARSGASRA